MDVPAYALLLVAIVLGVMGQVLLKVGMSRVPTFRVAQLATLARNAPVLAGFGCYGLSVLLYFRVLSSLDLSLAYPTVSLGYVLVMLISRVLFKEPVGLARVAAALVICAGVVMVGVASR